MKAKTVICLMLVAGTLGGILLLLTLSPLEDETLFEAGAPGQCASESDRASLDAMKAVLTNLWLRMPGEGG